MSRAVLGKVFDPYFTTKGEAGTGLGVPQVCAFVQRMGGHINVQSAIGIGTTFDLAFPAAIEAAPTGNLAWRPVDRWINEGGAGEEATRNPLGRDGIKTPVVPETGAQDCCQ
jgi:hypothetical protein